VHRHAASGALSGLFRVRNFTQDDAHIFCRPDQLIDEVIRLLRLFDYFYDVFGLTYDIYLSTRPEKDYIGSIAIWDRSEAALAEACTKIGKSFTINPGDGAFYGPKLDFKLKDSMNRIWQCGTIQLDMNLPERFDLTYINELNDKVRPIMLHRAIYGSLERFIGILIEHYGGAFPLWLAPVQAIVLPVHQGQHSDYAESVKAQLIEAGIRTEIDASDEKLGYRLRNAQIQKIPVTIVVGDKEVASVGAMVRRYGEEKQVATSVSGLIEALLEEIRVRSLTAIALK
jgi:threonyl-tRNA synthetase